MDAYLTLLNTLLQPDQTARKQAEQHFKNQAKTDPKFPLILLEITLNSEVPSSLRQSAIVNLRRHITNNWSGIEERHEVDILPEARAVLKENLFKVLADPESKIRAAGASCLSTIASHDWPHDFGNFCPELLKYLSESISQNAALIVLQEFSQDIDVQNLNEFVNTFFQPLAKIVLNKDEKLLDKMDGMMVFYHGFNLSSECDGKSKKIMAQNVEPCVDLINNNLTMESSSPEYFGLLTSSIKVATLLLRHFAKVFLPSLQTVLNNTWAIFTSSIALYQEHYINNDSGNSLDSELDNGDKIGISTFLSETILFLTEITTTKTGKKLISPMMGEILSCLVILSQVTAGTEEEWNDDIETFHDDQEAIISGSYSMAVTCIVRAVAQEAIIEVMPYLTTRIQQITISANCEKISHREVGLLLKNKNF